MQNAKVLSVSCPKCSGAIRAHDSEWKCVQCSYWISAFDGIGQRRSIVEVEEKALEANGKRRPRLLPAEAPSVVLDSLLSDIHKQDGKVAGDLVPKAAREHSNYAEGNGSRELPFVIHTSNTIRSAEVQREIIDGIYGAGTKHSASRFYYVSQRGLPGNGDLCEHRFVVNGEGNSVWFDLYLVTRLVNDPELKRTKAKGMAEMSKNPEFVRLQNEMRQILGLPVQQKPKGCLGVFALFVGFFILIWIFGYLV